ncbi:MAG: DUF2147 domain-containing protein [Rhodobacteraceae bacterium]|nr:MAG: DUF2147 domain-containing protein [Paracoccaceae bacterium]
MTLAALVALAAPVAALAQEVAGVWRTEATDEGYLEVRIAPCGEAICGTILGARDLTGHPQPYDHAGRWMIRDMMPAGPGAWSGGEIWDPRNGRTFRSKMALSGSDLTVSGCVLGFCQGQVWRRVN